MLKCPVCGSTESLDISVTFFVAKTYHATANENGFIVPDGDSIYENLSQCASAPNQSRRVYRPR